jgi:hypothetical protein
MANVKALLKAVDTRGEWSGFLRGRVTRYAVSGLSEPRAAAVVSTTGGSAFDPSTEGAATMRSRNELGVLGDADAVLEAHSLRARLDLGPGAPRT